MDPKYNAKQASFKSIDPISDSLEHHGVKGQKWGVRRYRNKDGTLTSEGKARYSIKDTVSRKLHQKQSERAERRASAKREKQIKEERKRERENLSKLSNEQLREKATRMELENRYRAAYANSNPGARKVMASFFVGSILIAGVEAGGKQIIKGLIVNDKGQRDALIKSIKKAGDFFIDKVLEHSNYEDELYHHGIKGQKWGDRNGPPYPLGADDHSQREAKAGSSGWTSDAKKETNKGLTSTNQKTQKTTLQKTASNKSIEHIRKTLAQKDKNIATAHENHNRIIAKAKRTGKSAAEIEQEENFKTEKFHLSDKQKTAIKVGAAVAVAALATYGAYKYSSTRTPNGVLSIPDRETFNNMLSKAAESGKTDFLKSAFGDKADFSAFSNTYENKNLLNMALTSSSGKWWNRLSKVEKAGIEAYSGNAYAKMNNALWAAKGENILKHTDPVTAMNITMANKALQKASFPMDMVCTQGLSTDKACKFLGCSENDLIKAATDSKFASRFIGNVNTNHGLFSTTSTASGGFGGGVKYSVLTPKGAHAAFIEHISAYGDLRHPPSWNGSQSGGPPFSLEFETLFAAGSKFKTRGIRYNEAGGFIEVALEYLLDD